LTVLVLFSTLSFTIEKHFCGDVLVNISMFSEVDYCGMETPEMLQKKSCCKDEIVFVKGQDELKSSSFEDLDLKQQYFLTLISYSYIDFFEGLQKQIIPHKNYSPPNLISDIPILHQVFII